MGTLPVNSTVTINDTDSFHPVQQVNPVHLAHVYSKCQDPYGPPCVLNTTTVSENSYSYLDNLDSGFESTAAIEIKTKMSSRQKIWIYAGVPESQANFTELDGGSNCAQINQYALDWALQNAGWMCSVRKNFAPLFFFFFFFFFDFVGMLPLTHTHPHNVHIIIIDSKTLTRYYNVGEKMVMGKDIGPLNDGPVWIWTRMRYVQVIDCKTNSPYLEVRSPMLRTPINYRVRSAAGYHYCKAFLQQKLWSGFILTA
ncbi:hypothetical protein RFI_23428 [Reticulomyxa filosa]|uniref:Uncharacterized protein n=1 Tax=Reticulomyxa filosa TaxID=46433 RepID=X6MLK4_RETFI|nr:hypothetical protein RFI_23428 [Reticulomyxa filosa]|eukprot:ETO13940.1 hypothetical protein RFI_23428 [Reticulomyxa filosa]